MSEGKSLATKIHHTLDYRAKTQAVPRYDLSDVYPQTGNRELKLSQNTRTTLEFELPPRCVNLARSKLEWDLEISTKNTAVAGIDPQTLHIKSDAISFIERVEVFTRSGVRLMDLDRQQLWSRISNSYFQDPAEYGVQKILAVPTMDDLLNTQQIPWFVKHVDDDSQSDIVGRAVAKGGLKSSHKIKTNGYSNANPGADPVGTVKSSSRAFSLDLGHFRDSILAVDKTLFFGGQVLNIKLHFAGYDDFIYKNKTVINPDANLDQYDAQVGTEPVGTSPVANLNINTVKFKDIAIRCAFESNPVIIAQIKQKVMSKSGLSLFVPYTYFIEQTGITPTGQQTMITRLNRGYGIRLHRLVTTVTPSAFGTHTKLAEELTKWDTNNMSDMKDDANNRFQLKSKVKSYYTTLNNRRLQERDIIVKNSDDKFTLDSYNYSKSCLKGTLMDSPYSHLQNWCHIDSFDGYDVKSKDHINTVTGLPLSDDMQYTFHGQLDSQANKVKITTFAVCQRSLLLKADSVTIV